MNEGSNKIPRGILRNSPLRVNSLCGQKREGETCFAIHKEWLSPIDIIRGRRDKTYYLSIYHLRTTSVLSSLSINSRTSERS